MESPINVIITPHHHHLHSNSSHFGTGAVDHSQPKSFTNSLVSSHSQHSYYNGDSRSDQIRRSPTRLYTPPGYQNTHQGSDKRKLRSGTHTPSIHSSGDGESTNAMMLGHSSTSAHGHPQMNENILLRTSISSHSITPPNSNSNTTISCGSGNSTSVNIGVHVNTPNSTTPNTTLINHNNNHVKRETDQNLRNKVRPIKAKKCILEEEDEEIEKCVKVAAAPDGSRARGSWPNQEFLPICDALFNVISLAAYFCDIVFDLLTAYTWYKMSQETEEFFSLNPQENDPEVLHQLSSSRSLWQWSMAAIFFISLSTLLTQSLSFKWYKESVRRGQIGPDGTELEGPPTPFNTGALAALHLSACGVLWRYFKLFIPVDLRFVKNEVRDLCLLRLVHAFCEAVPMLLMQLYLIWGAPSADAVSDFTIVSTSLSLFSVCWALASFNKNVRKENLHKLVLTWLGVIFQLLWHVGTLVSRVLALSLYASVYHFAIYLVLILHWFCVLLWLILYNGEKISTFRKIINSSLLAVVYTFCYVNVQESNSRQKVIIYYVTMLLENSLLLGVWLIAKRYEDEVWYRREVIFTIFLSFFGGIFFMCLYYRYFHLKRLSYVYDAESSIYRSNSILNSGGDSSSVNINGAIYNSSHNNEKATVGKRGGMGCIVGDSGSDSNVNIVISPKDGRMSSGGLIISNKRVPAAQHNQRVGLKSDKNSGDGSVGGQRGALRNKVSGHHIHPNVPGVFNCSMSRFHPARKKKKPTPFVVHQQSPLEEAQEEESSPKHTTCGKHQNRAHSINNNNSSFTDNDGQLVRNCPENNGHHSPEDFEADSVSSSSKVRMPSGRMSHPFWKRPLSIALCSEAEGSVGSRVDIQQKEQDERKQLGKVKGIGEEIKQGKLQKPNLNEILQSVPVHQAVPVDKKQQPWFHGHEDSIGYPHPYMTPTTDPNANEIILDPQYLMYASPTMEHSDRCYYDNPEWAGNYYEPEPMYENNDENQEDEEDEYSNVGNGRGMQRRKINKLCSPNGIYKSYRMTSDAESQMSIPRSYTLPREYKYKKKFRKPVKMDQFVPSTNSSDGDVDSGGEDPEIYGSCGPYPLPFPIMQHVHEIRNEGDPTKSNSAPQPSKTQGMSRRHKMHETKL